MVVNSLNKMILESILDDIEFDDLPITWSSLDTKKFSSNKMLYTFQEEAIKNLIKLLFLYFNEDNQNKNKFFQRYIDNNLDQSIIDNISFPLKKFKDRLDLTHYYNSSSNSIIFEEFINRCALWMATGSGKSLIIIKLIEILHKLMELGEIPRKDILLLTQRDDLLNQIKSHVKEFNTNVSDNGLKIDLRSLIDYEKIKRNSLVAFFNEFVVFCYRSDLISDEQKEKIIDFKDYENQGNWYVILDEAHKGDRDESKRQMFYSILSRNGFLFNFSAIFVDIRDQMTTAYNFNLERFISEGYGKHIYMSKQDLKSFREKNDFDYYEKQKIVLKILVLITYIKKEYRQIQEINEKSYHEPLLLSLVNTVNFKDAKNESDLKIFFNELERIGRGEVAKGIFENAIKEITEEFKSDISFFYEKETNLKIKFNKLGSITLNEILKYIFNADSFGNIEALSISTSSKEVLLKLKTSDIPFALIKIGDATQWISENLQNYEINESYQKTSIFEDINNRDDINILMGSRAFYEGWDSNRPNVILFINIGIGVDAKKFIIQAIGRGIRIEPLKNKRKRLRNLKNSNNDEGLYEKISETIDAIETLFVFGTNINAMTEIIESLKNEKVVETIELETDTDKQFLFIPVWKKTSQLLYELRTPQKFLTSKEMAKILTNYFEDIDPRILSCIHGFEPKFLKFLIQNIDNSNYFIKSNDRIINSDIRIEIQKIIKHFNIYGKEFDRFKSLEDEIIHFKKIIIATSETELLSILKDKINKVKQSTSQEQMKQDLIDKFEKKIITLEQYTSEIELLAQIKQVEEVNGLLIKNIANHYYFPVIISKNEKVDYIRHIIDIKSEKLFLEQLESYYKIYGKQFNFDWWMFSKLDEHLDEIKMPYYDPENNILTNFKPDFIFWIKKGTDYKIVFVDPKGISHTQYQHKVDWFEKYFGSNENPLVIYHNGLRMNISLYMITDDINKLPNRYKNYWLDQDNLSTIFKFN